MPFDRNQLPHDSCLIVSESVQEYVAPRLLHPDHPELCIRIKLSYKNRELLGSPLHLGIFHKFCKVLRPDLFAFRRISILRWGALREQVNTDCPISPNEPLRLTTV